MKVIALFICLFSSLVYGEEKLEYSSISDCTDSGWELSKEYWTLRDTQTDIEKKYIAVEPIEDLPERKLYLDLATVWATENEYLPCDKLVCGVVTKTKTDRVLVSIGSAWIIVDPSTEKVVDGVKLHYGCYHYLKRENHITNMSS